MRTFKFKLAAAGLLIFGGIGMQAQNKFSASYETDSEVVVELQASHTSIIVEPWNRREVKIEAYLDDKDLSHEQSRQMLESWNFDTRASQSRISIRSNGGSALPLGMPKGPTQPRERSQQMSSLLNLFSPDSDSVNPLRELYQMQFDFEAYNKDGAQYLEQWEQQVKEKLGDNAQVAVHTWSSGSGDSLQNQQMQQHMATMKERMEMVRAQMDSQFGSMLEQMSQQFMGQMNQQPGLLFGENSQGASKTQRIIKLRVPQNTRLVLEVRHGAVDLKGELNELHGLVSYASFTAETLSGANTRLRVSYAPVEIDVWNHGELYASYTPSFEIGTVGSLQLRSNSGDLKIGEILDTALISGTFGAIEIAELGKNFRLLDLKLNNSDLNLNMPNTSFNFVYNGSRSEITYPDTFKTQHEQSFDSEYITGHHKSVNPNANINIQAQYSKVDLKL